MAGKRDEAKEPRWLSCSTAVYRAYGFLSLNALSSSATFVFCVLGRCGMTVRQTSRIRQSLCCKPFLTHGRARSPRCRSNEAICCFLFRLPVSIPFSKSGAARSPSDFREAKAWERAGALGESRFLTHLSICFGMTWYCHQRITNRLPNRSGTKARFVNFMSCKSLSSC